MRERVEVDISLICDMDSDGGNLIFGVAGWCDGQDHNLDLISSGEVVDRLFENRCSPHE